MSESNKKHNTICVMRVNDKLDPKTLDQTDLENLRYIMQSCLDLELRENLDLYMTDSDFSFLARRINGVIQKYGSVDFGFLEMDAVDGKELSDETGKYFHVLTELLETMDGFAKQDLIIAPDSFRFPKNEKFKLISVGGKQKKENKQAVHNLKESRVESIAQKYPDSYKEFYAERDRVYDKILDDLDNGKLSKEDYNLVIKYCDQFYEVGYLIARVENRPKITEEDELFTKCIGYFKEEIDDLETFVKGYNETFIKSQVEENSAQKVLEKTQKFKEDFEKELIEEKVESYINSLFQSKRMGEQNITLAYQVIRQKEKALKDIKEKRKEYEKLKKSLTPEQKQILESYVDKNWNDDISRQEKEIQDGKAIIDKHKKVFDEQDKRYRDLKQEYKETEKKIDIYKEVSKKEAKRQKDAEEAKKLQGQAFGESEEA